jgi:hypothetical protein
MARIGDLAPPEGRHRLADRSLSVTATIPGLHGRVPNWRSQMWAHSPASATGHGRPPIGIRKGHGRWWPVVNGGQQCWKACWGQPLKSSNLLSSATLICAAARQVMMAVVEPARRRGQPRHHFTAQRQTARVRSADRAEREGAAPDDRSAQVTLVVRRSPRLDQPSQEGLALSCHFCLIEVPGGASRSPASCDDNSPTPARS